MTSKEKLKIKYKKVSNKRFKLINNKNMQNKMGILFTCIAIVDVIRLRRLIIEYIFH